MKILLIFVGHYVNGYRPEEDYPSPPRQLLNEQFVKNIKSIKENLLDINNINTIEIATLYSEENELNKDSILLIESLLEKKIKYKYSRNLKQLSKMTHFLNELQERYDWYIKFRPDFELLEKIDNIKLNSLKKDSINARLRSYVGPELKLDYGSSVGGAWIRVHNKEIKYSNSLIESEYVLDDQIYLFHDNIRDKAFKPILDETSKQHEYFHRNYWRDKVRFNPIGLNLRFYHPLGLMLSGHIDVKNTIDNL